MKQIKLDQPKELPYFWGVILIVIILALAIWGNVEVSQAEEVLPEPTPTAIEKRIEVPVRVEVYKTEYLGTEADFFVEKYSTKYVKSPTGQSKMKSIMHCLLYKESKHGKNLGKGDNGLASGPLQYHAGTYVAFRKTMIKEGLVTVLGDRDNLEDSIETTVWALTEGKGKQWGPILRGECMNF